jgi:hypothetical protein
MANDKGTVRSVQRIRYYYIIIYILLMKRLYELVVIKIGTTILHTSITAALCKTLL